MASGAVSSGPVGTVAPDADFRYPGEKCVPQNYMRRIEPDRSVLIRRRSGAIPPAAGRSVSISARSSALGTERGAGLDVGQQLLGRGGAGDDRRHLRLGQQPAEGDLQHAHAALVGEGLQALEAVPRRRVQQVRLLLPQPTPGRRIGSGVLAGQQPVGQREERQHAEAEGVGGRQQLALDVAVQQRVLVLRRDERCPRGACGPPRRRRPSASRRSSNARCSGPFRRPPDRPGRPGSPRSASADPAGATGRGRSSRCPAGAATPRPRPGCSGGIRGRRSPVRSRPPASMPNLVATTTSAAAFAQRRTEELLAATGRLAVDVGHVEQRDPGVERGVDEFAWMPPASRSRCVARPRLLQPSPTTDTDSPERPTRRRFSSVIGSDYGPGTRRALSRSGAAAVVAPRWNGLVNRADSGCPPSTRSSTARPAARPCSAAGCTIVVRSCGTIRSSAMPSKPTTLRSSGHPQPQLLGGLDHPGGQQVALRHDRGRSSHPGRPAVHGRPPCPRRR